MRMGTVWRQDGESLVSDSEHEDFKAAMTYVNRVAGLAEEHNHHPDIAVHGWNKVTLTLTTHDEGGLTQADHDMAERISALS